LRDNGNGFGGGFSETTTAGNFDPVAGAVVANNTTNFVGAATRGSSSRTGWTLGLGAEYAFWNNWSVKAEYLYANFGNSNSAPLLFLPGAVAVANNGRGRNENIVRMGVNLKFW
jgi:outer membrane immunogenic protein